VISFTVPSIFAIADDGNKDTIGPSKSSTDNALIYSAFDCGSPNTISTDGVFVLASCLRFHPSADSLLINLGHTFSRCKRSKIRGKLARPGSNEQQNVALHLILFLADAGL